MALIVRRRRRAAKTEGDARVPTGVAIRDPRGQLFEAAERVLRRDGPGGLTSRAVTDEAGVAKGVLHRHFADFDTFLVELTLDRVAAVGALGDRLRAAAGTGTVAGNLAPAIAELLAPPALALIGLIIARDELRTRLRAATGSRLPLVAQTTAALAGYLAAEQAGGRVAAEADVQALASALSGAAHLLFADTDGPAPDADAIAAMVVTVLVGTA